MKSWWGSLSWILVWILLSILPFCFCTNIGEQCDDTTNPCIGSFVCSSVTNKCRCQNRFIYKDGSCVETFYNATCKENVECPFGAKCINATGGDGGVLTCVGVPGSLLRAQMSQFVDEDFNVVFNITWIPGRYTGTTYFAVDVEGRDIFSLNYNYGSATITEDGASELITKTYIFPGWTYRMSVTPRTAAGNGPKYSLPDVIALSSKPGLVENVQVKQDYSYANEMQLSFECPSDSRTRGGNITGFIIRKTLTTGGANLATEYTVPHNFVSRDCKVNVNASQVGGIAVLNNYTFEVKIKNSDYEGNYTAPVDLYTNERWVFVSNGKYDMERLVGPYRGRPRGKQPQSFPMRMCSSCFIDPTQGPIIAAALLICISRKDEPCYSQFPDKLALRNNDGRADDLKSVPTWATAKRNNFATAFRATPDDWVNQLHQDNSENYVYSVGSNLNCNENDTTVFCNGPLPKDKRFGVAVAVCNGFNCEVSFYEDDSFNTIEEQDDDKDSIIIGLAVGLALAVLICLALIIYFFLTRSRKGQTTFQGQEFKTQDL